MDGATVATCSITSLAQTEHCEGTSSSAYESFLDRGRILAIINM